jgi:hypothetical protein
MEGGALVVDRLPNGEMGGKLTSRVATLDDIQKWINDAVPVNKWAATFSSLGQHRLEINPMSIRETGIIHGVFHAPTEPALKIGRGAQVRRRVIMAHFCRSLSARLLKMR